MSDLRLFVDYAACIGCETCEAVCGFVHGKPRIHMIRSRDGVMMPLYCQHCASPKCVRACPRGAIEKRADGAVVLDEGLCASCRERECIDACPFGAIFSSDPCEPVLKCDLCDDRREEGLAPACTEACPCGAISLIERSQVAEMNTPKSKAAFKRVMELLKPPPLPDEIKTRESSDGR